MTKDNALLWTDSRYFLQAGKQLPSFWTLMKAGTPDCPKMHVFYPYSNIRMHRNGLLQISLRKAVLVWMVLFFLLKVELIFPRTYLKNRSSWFQLLRTLSIRSGQNDLVLHSDMNVFHNKLFLLLLCCICLMKKLVNQLKVN